MLFLLARCIARRDDANHFDGSPVNIFLSRGVSHHHKQSIANLAKRLSALFTILNPLFQGHVQRIPKDFRRIFETDPVFALVGEVLGLVPLEPDSVHYIIVVANSQGLKEKSTFWMRANRDPRPTHPVRGMVCDCRRYTGIAPFLFAFPQRELLIMESFFARYRNYLVLLAVLAVQIVGLAVQVRRAETVRTGLDSHDGPGVRLIRLWAEGLVAPPERLIHNSKTGLIYLWQSYLDLHRVHQQNQEMQQTIDRLRLEQASLLEDARQGERLQKILDFQEKYIYKTLAAQAIGSSGSDQSRVFYIDKGSDFHIEPDMAVITGDGIVGKVREVFPHTAQVLVINDQTSGAGVILETTRIRGILRGNAAGQTQIVGILADQRIQPGEKVLTAGGDQIFPRGLPVGVVEKVLRDPDRDSFIDVMVKPAAHIERLDEVLVITSTLPRFSDQQQQDLATSEAEKGPEVAAIKEQKKAAELMAERLPGLKDPNQPPNQPPNQTPGQTPASDPATPNPTAHPPQALHPDRFSPATGDAAPAKPETLKPGSPASPPLAKPSGKPAAPSAAPQRRIP